jgi:hypothetical protein
MYLRNLKERSLCFGKISYSGKYLARYTQDVVKIGVKGLLLLSEF